MSYERCHYCRDFYHPDETKGWVTVDSAHTREDDLVGYDHPLYESTGRKICYFCIGKARQLAPLVKRYDEAKKDPV